MRRSFLNDKDFNEKKGILIFISIHDIIIMAKKVGWDSIKYLKSINNGFSISIGKLTIKRAFTGEGSPLNSFRLALSILNFAKRIEVARVIRKPTKPNGTNDMLNSFSSNITGKPSY